MLKSVEVIGKTKEEAVNNALAQLNASEDEVSVEVIEEGARGFLGIGSKPFKVKVSVNTDPVKVAKEFLREVFVAIGVSVEVNFDFSDGKNLNIDLKGDNMGVIIGKRGQTLDSLQYLTGIIVNKKQDTFVNVKIDTEYYREKRKETLERLAIGLAKKAKHLKRDVVLEPMNPKERKIIHATLQNDRYVNTHSEGDGDSRYVVISLKDEYKESYTDGYRRSYNRDYSTGYNKDYSSDYKDYNGSYKGSYYKGSGSYRSDYKSGYKKYSKGGYKSSYRSDYKKSGYDYNDDNEKDRIDYNKDGYNYDSDSEKSRIDYAGSEISIEESTEI